jgi:xylulokinase
MSYSGGSLAWCRRLLALEETDDAFSQRAAQSPPGAGGLVFTPYLLGERAPIHDASARGTLHGLSAQTTTADVVRAVLEGVACGLRQNVELLEQVCGQETGPLVLTGKPAQNALWSQIKADILGRPLRVLGYEDQSLLGAALCGAAAAGAVDLSPASRPALRRTLDHVLRPAREFAPRQELHDLYNEVHARYVGIYPALRDLGSI